MSRVRLLAAAVLVLSVLLTMLVGGSPFDDSASAAPATPAAPLDDPPVIDSFNRPDENPLSDGGKWTALNGSPLAVVAG